MIGFFDVDLVVDKMLHFPNLELMKLFAFYKKQLQPTILLNEYSDLSNCEQIFIRREKSSSELSPQLHFPIESNWGGLYYTNYKYKPFLDSAIENQRPSILLYQNYIQERLLTRPKVQLNKFDFWLKSSYIRLHSGQPIQFQHIMPGAPLLIYDYNISGQEYLSLQSEILARQPRYILYRWPLLLDTFQSFEGFIANKLLVQHCGIVTNYFLINMDMSYTDFRKFIVQYGTSIKPIPDLRLFMPVLPSQYQHHETTTNREYILCLEKALQFVYYALSRGYNIYPFYIPNRNNPLDMFFKLIVNYFNDPSKQKYTGAIKNYLIRKSKKDYEAVIKMYPDIKPLFDISIQQLRMGGDWYGKFRYQE